MVGPHQMIDAKRFVLVPFFYPGSIPLWVDARCGNLTIYVTCLGTLPFPIELPYRKNDSPRSLE
jgi:hypothetical protein